MIFIVSTPFLTSQLNFRIGLLIAVIIIGSRKLSSSTIFTDAPNSSLPIHTRFIHDHNLAESKNISFVHVAMEWTCFSCSYIERNLRSMKQ